MLLRNFKIQTTPLLVSVILSALLTCAASVRAESPRRLNNQGIRAFQEKKYQQAAISFQKAQKAAPENLLLKYNQGVAESAEQKMDDAVRSLTEASKARDPEVTRRAHYGLGLLHYNEAQKKAQAKQLPEALKDAEAAVTANQSALLSDSKDPDARVNFELSSLLKRQIEQMVQQQQKQQNQNNQQNQQDQKQQEQDKQKDQQHNKQEQDKQQSQQGNQQDQNQKQQGQQNQPAPTPSPAPSPAGKEEQRNPQQSAQPTATPTPAANADQNNASKQKSQPEQGQQSKPEKIKKSAEQEAAESILNVLDDNDAAALKQMRKQRYGTIVQPEKDW